LPPAGAGVLSPLLKGGQPLAQGGKSSPICQALGGGGEAPFDQGGGQW